VESPVTEDREEEYMFNQPKITKVINKMKSYQRVIAQSYLDRGKLN
jgi:uncharacterized C2H2 Zn-finger protein